MRKTGFCFLSPFTLLLSACRNAPLTMAQITGSDWRLTELFQSRWFYALSSAMLALAGYGAYRWRARRLKENDERTRAEERFTKAFHANPTAMSITRLADRTFVEVNENWLRTIGLTRQEVIGKTADDLQFGTDPILRQRFYQRLREAGSVREYEASVQFRDDLHTVLISAEIITSDGDECVLWSYQDITARRRAEELLRQSEARLRMLVEGTNAILFSTDRRGHLTYVNEAAARVMELPLEQLTGSFYLEFIHPDDRARAEALWMQQLITGEPETYIEVRYMTGSGRTIWLSFYVNPLKQGDRIIGLTGVAQDITERKRAGESLRASERRYRQLVEHQTEYIVSWLPGGIRTFVNNSYCRYAGQTRDELLGASWFPPEPDAEAQLLIERLAALTPDNPFYENEQRATLPDGKIVWTQWVNYAFFENGRITEYQSVGRDITARRLADEALRESEENFRRMVMLSPIATAVTDESDVTVLLNEKFVTTFGYTIEDLPTVQHWWALVYPDPARRERFRAIWEGEVAGLLSSGREVKPVEAQIRCRDGSLRTVEFRHSALGNRTIHVLNDVTELKRAEEELKASREELRNLAARLQAVREEERTTIAREIHDELGQALTGLKMDLKWLENRLPPEAQAPRNRLTSALELVSDTITAVRRIATSLRPGVLDDFGLSAAIEWQASEFESRTGIRCQMARLPDELPVTEDQATAVFRIFQETLTNVARHAAATRVEVNLAQNDDTLWLQVKDNGRGVTTEEIRHTRSLGLVGMRERAWILGGEFRVSGEPGLGTTVTVQIPLKPAPAKESPNDQNPRC
ncbi:MAG: PAS domain S-box protein [Blastocatellia bacterium]